jgi:D-arabinose 1-dehydrogenase-like Zn-dependent alcohol dehydrogenase
VLGLGGLGHLEVQYAAKMGFHTVGIARGKGTSRTPERIDVYDDDGEFSAG